MGESKQKSLNRAQVLKADPLCIYCRKPSTTWDHMPPKAMFKDKHRPGGMEYGCCDACNSGTRTSDAVAAFIAHTTIADDWKVKRLVELLGTIAQQEPNFKEEFFRRANPQNIFIKHNSGLLTRAIKARINGPIVDRHLKIFSVKLGMALFREHTGEAMSENSGVYFGLLGTPTINQADDANAIIAELPGLGRLKQGAKTSDGQFVYRYVSDQKSLFAGIVGFHANLHISLIAIDDLEKHGSLIPSTDRLTLVKRSELLSLIKPVHARDQRFYAHNTK